MNEVETALTSVLVGTSGLTTLLAAGTAGVFNALARQGASYPLVVFQQQSGVDDNKSPHRARQLLYLVKGIAQGPMDAAGSIDAQIDAVLHGAVLTVTGWTNVSLLRERDVRYAEVGADGKRYTHSGGIYRVRLAR